MVNNEFKKDISRALKRETINTELSPGTTGRRFEPPEGIGKLNERIHKESAYTDKYKNLPFTFSKPKKCKPSRVKVCANCGTFVGVSKDTIGIICRKCKKFSKVVEIDCVEK